MYNPDTYDWYQCDEEDYDSGDAPEERAEGQRLGALIDELTAFDAAFLAEHGVYPAACDLPEHLLCLAEQENFDPNIAPEDRSDVVPEWQYKSFDW